MRQVLRGGTVVDGLLEQSARADVAIEGDRIVAVGDVAPESGDVEIDCGGRLILPGFIDAHAHADSLVFDDAVQLALLRQGVTSVVGGQDGVSIAPGDGAWANRYFGSINGGHPRYAGGGVASLLAAYDGATRLNAAYLAPAGTIRHEVMGMTDAPPTAEQTSAMQDLVARALEDGAVGLSSGLDYVPGIFAGASEIADLCLPVAAAGALYVTHMRGGYESNSAAGLAEVAEIAAASGVRAHVSHLHLDADDAWRLLAEHSAAGLDLSFDMYPYTRGCSLVSMALLPPAYSALEPDVAVERLTDAAERRRLIEGWFPTIADKPSLGPEWPTMVTIAHASAAEWTWAPSLTLAAIAERRGATVEDATLDLLAASRLRATAVMAVRDERSDDNLGRLFAHPGFVGGSDGIFVGAHPHPRAAGAFARYLASFTGAGRPFTWEQIARRLSGRTAELFRLGRRGAVRRGWIADLVVVDPSRVRDNATYADPTAVADGIDDVFVGGGHVLASGALTDTLTGRGIRRSRS